MRSVSINLCEIAAPGSIESEAVLRCGGVGGGGDWDAGGVSGPACIAGGDPAGVAGALRTARGDDAGVAVGCTFATT